MEIKVFPRRQIDPDRSGPCDHRAPRRAVPERVLLDQAGGIEESIDRLLASGQVRIADQVRTQSLVGSHLGDVARELRSHRKSGLQLDNAVRRPPVKKLLDESMRVLGERQLEYRRNCETLLVIQIRPPLLRLQVQDVLCSRGRKPLAPAAPTGIVRDRLAECVSRQER